MTKVPETGGEDSADSLFVCPRAYKSWEMSFPWRASSRIRIGMLLARTWPCWGPLEAQKEREAPQAIVLSIWRKETRRARWIQTSTNSMLQGLLFLFTPWTCLSCHKSNVQYCTSCPLWRSSACIRTTQSHMIIVVIIIMIVIVIVIVMYIYIYTHTYIHNVCIHIYIYIYTQ